MTHRVTQLYPEGACVYFYLAIYAQVKLVAWSGYCLVLVIFVACVVGAVVVCVAAIAVVIAGRLVGAAGSAGVVGGGVGAAGVIVVAAFVVGCGGGASVVVAVVTGTGAVAASFADVIAVGESRGSSSGAINCKLFDLRPKCLAQLSFRFWAVGYGRPFF